MSSLPRLGEELNFTRQELAERSGISVPVLFPKSRNGYLIFMNGDSAEKVFEALFRKQLNQGRNYGKGYRVRFH